MSAALGISEALRAFGVGRPKADRVRVERLEEELVSFLGHRGFPVDEEAGRRVALLPADRLDGQLAWAFVADHLITRVSEPVEEVCRLGRLFVRALRDAARRGAMEPERADACVEAASAAVEELPRLDRLARTLRDSLGDGRPGADLYESDPEAYARAMQRWESQLPLAQEELEGGFVVHAVDPIAVDLRHPRREEGIELRLPPTPLQLVRAGDRLDARLGRDRNGWFLVDVWAAAAPGRQASTASNSDGLRP